MCIDPKLPLLAILLATFVFTLVLEENEDCTVDTLPVTEGRFDVRFTKF